MLVAPPMVTKGHSLNVINKVINMQTRTIVLSEISIKAVKKFIGAQPMTSPQDSGLTQAEREALYEAYILFKNECEEMVIDESVRELSANV